MSQARLGKLSNEKALTLQMITINVLPLMGLKWSGAWSSRNTRKNRCLGNDYLAT